MIQCVVCLVLLLAASVGLYFSGRYFFVDVGDYFHINVNSKEIIWETDEKFLSVALDMSFMRCMFHKLSDRDWEKLEELTNLLSPAYLRIGGTDADRTLFNFNTLGNRQFIEAAFCEDHWIESNLTITGEDWIKLNKFVQKSGLSLIIDLNVLLRKRFEWDSSNAEALIKFSEENSFSLDFQLGNEPNNFPHLFNLTITGDQLAKDFYKLRELLNSTKAYKKSKLIGPDVTAPKTVEGPSMKYLAEFLSQKDVIDIVSWHQYYLNGRTATLEDFINIKTFNFLPPQIEFVNKIVRQFSPIKPIWISETSSAYGGGAPKLSNRYVASFLWLDKLGVASRAKMSVVIRQSLFKGYYALINENLTPTSDFWISVLYKHLVGTRVLNVKVAEDGASKLVRFYGHCLASNSSINGSLVIYGMNLSNQTEVFVPSGISIVYPVYSYIFRPEFYNLKAKTVLLNDQPLVYNQTVVSHMLHMAKEVELPLYLPAYSIGFWVIKETAEIACQR